MSTEMSNVSSVGTTANVESLWNEAKELFYQDIGDSKRAKLAEQTTLSATIADLKSIQGRVSKEYGTHVVHIGGDKTVDIKLGHVMKRLELLFQAGDVTMNFAPESVSLVWWAFRTIFTGFLIDSTTCTFLTDAVDQISEMMFVCQVCADRYLKDAESMAEEVMKQIPPLYAMFLKFSYQTRGLFTHRKIVRLGINFFGAEAQNLKDTLADAQAKRDKLRRTAGLAFEGAALHLLESLNQDLRILGDLSKAVEAEVVPGIKNIQASLSRQEVKAGKAQEKQELQKKFQEHLDWLQSGVSAPLKVPEGYHSRNLKERHPGTCKWVTQTEEFRAWRDKTRPSLLYLLGKGGYGKSFLISTIIESLENDMGTQVGPQSRLKEQDGHGKLKQSTDMSEELGGHGKQEQTSKLGERSLLAERNNLLIYFFCKAGDNSTQQGAKIMRHLVAQLLHSAHSKPLNQSDDARGDIAKVETLVRVLQEAKAKLSTSERKDSSLIKKCSVLQSIFTDIAGALETDIFVVVDALDECSDGLADLYEALKRLPNGGANVRVLVSSRPSAHIMRDLRSSRNIEVTKEQTSADIRAFITASLKRVPRFKNILSADRRLATRVIAEKAEGHFK